MRNHGSMPAETARKIGELKRKNAELDRSYDQFGRRFRVWPGVCWSMLGGVLAAVLQ